MAERLTQLQDGVNMQAEHLCNAIGVLQQFAPPSFFPEFEKSSRSNINQQQNQEDYAQLFAQLIAKTAKEIDCLVESLPSEESTPELQAAHLRRLDSENQEAAQRLQDTVARGDKLLEQIQKALQDIAQNQLKMQCLQNTESLGSLSLDYGSSNSN